MRREEWTFGSWSVLPDQLAEAADRLVAAGQLPEFEEWFQ